MAIDITANQKATLSPDNIQSQELRDAVGQTESQQAAPKMQSAEKTVCPNCGAANDPGVVYCASCGQPVGMTACPNCGSELDADADFCETCHRYVKTDVCSFCGAHLTGQEAFCSECGNPRGGIVCPTCHTLNDFAFCKRCGTPLTDEARGLAAEIKQTPEFRELARLAREYDELSMEIPYASERDLARDEQNDQLRERVLRLLAEDAGVQEPVITKSEKKRLSKEERQTQKEALLDKITEMLEKMATPAAASPAKVRNYAMASKPVGVRLAWLCNYKHAMHSSPCGCAKPQLGGKWIILGKNTKNEIADDHK